jgi:lysophospholipase L1-like esterase
MVVIGDSIPFNSPNDCPGCTGFADSYGAAIEGATGQPVEVVNRSRHDSATTAMIDEQLASGELTSLLNGADIVIISTGFNDQSPYVETRPCAAESLATEEDLFAAVTATSDDCIDIVTQEVRQTAGHVLEMVRADAPDAAIGVLTSYDAWSGWPSLEAAEPATSDAVSDVIAHALDQWRTALCAEAEAVDAVCVDLYEGFNGADGQQVSAELLAADYTHPSQLGNDRIRDLLIASATTSAEGRPSRQLFLPNGDDSTGAAACDQCSRSLTSRSAAAYRLPARRWPANRRTERSAGPLNRQTWR